MDRDDVRMRERGDGAGLALKAIAERAVDVPGCVENLERNEAVELLVVRSVDFAHSAVPRAPSMTYAPTRLPGGRGIASG
jgi:hypothetical protein